MTIAFTATESKVIKSILGRGYANKIINYLVKHKVSVPNNMPSFISYIYQIVNGQKTSAIIQENILNLVATIKVQNEIATKRRKNILK